MTETLSPTLPAPVERKVHQVLETVCDLGLTIATAESCTGGLFASLLTDVDGCAHAFDRGFVSYTDQAKSDLLDVPPELIETHGAVSEAVARAMAAGALARSEADIVLAVTGFAGRGGPDDEPGLVFLAVGRRDAEIDVSEHHFGDIGRGAVRIACLDAGLNMLQALLAKKFPQYSKATSKA
jgi:nicotinamide-nucleotide amidase